MVCCVGEGDASGANPGALSVLTQRFGEDHPEHGLLVIEDHRKKPEGKGARSSALGGCCSPRTAFQRAHPPEHVPSGLHALCAVHGGALNYWQMA